MKPKVYAIVGPTGSGKTAFTLKLAGEIKKTLGLNAEIISADSRQVYKHIAITTAQPSSRELNEFRHYFICELELYQEFNAGEFGYNARKIIEDIFSRGRIPLIVGGSGLYINSLIYGLFEYDRVILKDEIAKQRKRLYDLLDEKGLDHLTEKLEELDPESMYEIKKIGITERRVIRALEVYLVTGTPLSVLKHKKPEIKFKPEIIGLHHSRERLYERINKRTDQMLKAGMIDEINVLYRKGFHYKKYNSLNTVGAREVIDYLEGVIKQDELSELIKRNTRRFAKRQLTWFRKDKNIKWIDAETESDKVIESVIKDLIEFKAER
ncbi:MAG: tRNA (adenosine(37)-N6)-dimethylallyltransferase MiaA [Ignavibacteria bacterium]|nr:tRNA (adenosine(37)-N6)-dimethylallyltransferase MiaA [Ignavibacteria bacterium]